MDFSCSVYRLMHYQSLFSKMFYIKKPHMGDDVSAYAVRIYVTAPVVVIVGVVRVSPTHVNLKAKNLGKVKPVALSLL